MKIIAALSISILIFLSSFFALHAEVPLSGNDVQHFMNAMKPLQELGTKYDFIENSDKAMRNQNPMANQNLSDFSPMTRSLKEIKGHEAYGEFEYIIRNAGFSSPQQWANVGDRVMKAYMSLKMIADITPEKIQEMKVSIEDIKKNEYLSPEIKKQLLNSMTQMMVMTTNIPKTTKADQETLKPYLAKLERLFEE